MSSKPKPQKRKCKFNSDLQARYKTFRLGRNENEAECIVCPTGTYISIANKGALDLDIHLKSNKHNNSVRTSESACEITNFFTPKGHKTEDQVRAAEGALAFHTVKHHMSYNSMDCTPKLNQKIYPDSGIVKKISCARTKVEAIINSVIAPHAIDVVMESLGGISCFGVATDGSNHGSTKLFPILIQYFDFKVGGIQTKVIELKGMANETSETISSYIIDVLRSRNLLPKCVAFAGDNTNTNFGGVNRRTGQNIYSLLKTKLERASLVGVGCPAHVLHNCIQHGADSSLSIDIDSIVLKIFNYFSIYTVRTESLKDFCDFVDINYSPLLYHSKTRWLSLLPAVTRILTLFPALKSYFQSIDKPPVAITNFFNCKFSEATLLFMQSLMTLFNSKIIQMEKETNSLLEIVDILEYIRVGLHERYEQSFIPLKVKEIVNLKREEGFDNECDIFEKQILEVYLSCGNYLVKWLGPFGEFAIFKWMSLSELPSWSDVEACLPYLNSKGIIINDGKCFDQVTNLRLFVSKNIAIEEVKFESFSSNEKWSKYFLESKHIDCHSELLKICEFFFAIPSHNANVERLFSLITAQWTKERNRLTVNSVKGLLVVQHNLKDYDCRQFYDYLLSMPMLLRQIGSSEKYGIGRIATPTDTASTSNDT